MSDQNRWYCYWLKKASGAERAGDLPKAIASLDVAERRTHDGEELLYLRNWRNRLKRELEAKT